MLFTNVLNLETTENNPKYPIFKITYYDTPYGAPTRGFGVKYYNDPLNESSSTFEDQYLAVDGKDNILAYDWGTGVAPGITTNGYFKSKYFGYFRANHTGKYTFYLSKEPSDYLAFYIATGTDRSTITNPGDSSQYLAGSKKINDWDTSYKGFETSGYKLSLLTSGYWYPMMIEYAQREKDSYVACRYLEPESTLTIVTDNDPSGYQHRSAVSHKKVVCASDFVHEASWANSASAAFMPGIIISGVTDASLEDNLNQSKTLEFKVPLLVNVDSTLGLMGFRYHPGADLYYDDNSSIFLRIGRLIQFSLGYSSNTTLTPNSYDYINKFEGIITDIKVNKGLKSSSLSITCQDILYNAITSINENYPNKLSYVLFDHTTNDTNGPNGVTRPVSYDAWPLVDVVRDLFYKSGIDSSKLYGRKLLNNVTSSITPGDYLIEDKNIYLPRRIKYGNCYSIGDDLEKDDTYIWSSNFGDKLYDIAAKLADTYGFVCEIDRRGNVVFGSVNSPVIDVVETGWVVGGDWKLVNDIRADGGKYLIATGTSGVYKSNVRLQKEVSGSWFVLNFLNKNLDQEGLPTQAQPSWSIPHDEYPSSFPFFDTDRNYNIYALGSNAMFGALYGRRPVDSYSMVGYYTIDSTIYVRPTVNIKVSDIQYSFYKDEATQFYNTFDTLCYADVYFGQVASNNPRDLIVSSLVLSHYKRPNRRISLKDNIHLDTPASMTAGNIYAFRFITKHDSWPTNEYPGLKKAYYTYKNTYINGIPGSPYATQFNCAYMLHRFDLNGIEIGTPTFSTDKDIYGACFGDFTFIGELIGTSVKSDYTRVNISRWNGSVYQAITGWVLDNLCHTRFNSNRPFRYPGDGTDFTGINPCKFYIYGDEIGINTSGTLISYGDYLIDITSSGTTASGSAITSIESYDIDFYSPKWEFSTDKNLTSLGFTQTIEDIRNDIIVIGDLIGEFRDYTTNEVINKNNPSLQYIYSRATDLSSINNPDSLNNVGRKKPFIIFEPTIVDQKHCDWMAEALLNRYNTFKKVPVWQSYGTPFLENYDNVYILDSYVGGMVNNKFNQWIISMSESISHNSYSVNVQTTPYLPWSTYSIPPGPSLVDFGNCPFINIKMTDSNDNYRGYTGVDDPRRYDVYESEISGNRLRLRYDQVIDGDIVVKVMSKNIMGIPFETAVAYLVGHLKDGEEIPEYRQWGTDYELYWDGVDKLGSARRKLGQTCNISGSDSSIIINNIDFVSSYDQPGFYTPSGEYYVKFMIFPRDRTLQNQSMDTLSLLKTYNTEASSRLGYTVETFEQLWNLSWGDPLDMYMTVTGNTGAGNRNITYSPNNTFYTDENNSQGIKFIFFSNDTTSSCNRTIYYKANMHHIHGLGYTFVLRNDVGYGALHYMDGPVNYSANNTLNWKMAYETTALGWKKYKCGCKDDVLIYDKYPPGGPVVNLLVEDWYRAALIPDQRDITGNYCDLVSYLRWNGNDRQDVDGSAPYWNDTNQPRILDDFYTMIESGGRYRVVCWYGTPYTNYSVEGFIPSRTHKYSSINPISFYFNPPNNNIGAWDLFNIPDMKNEVYNDFVRHLALASWFAGPETGWQNRVTPIVSHAFQVEVAIWDGTGRLLKNNKQLADIGPKPHDHGIWNWGYNSLHSNNASVTEHIHGYDPSVTTQSWSRKPHNRIITMHPAVAENIDDDLVNTYYDVWANYGIKHPYSLPSTYVSGLDFVADNTDNFGIGYCNITGSNMYGYWTWHGYWLGDASNSYMKLDYNIPAPYKEISISNHWMKYPRSLERGLLESSMIIQVNTNAHSDVFGDVSSLVGHLLNDIPYSDENYGKIRASGALNEDPYSSVHASLYNKISHVLSGWVRYNHTHLPIYEGSPMSYDGLYSLRYGLDNSRIYLGLKLMNPTDYDYTEGDYTRVTVNFVGNIKNELRFTGYGYNSLTCLPPIWYRSTVDFPWSDDTTNYNWWRGFLNPKFQYGGWSSSMVDKS